MTNRGWYNLPCWNGLSQYQQTLLIERGNLEMGFTPMGTCQNGAEVAVETQDDAAPGPRFYCAPCAVKYLSGDQIESLQNNVKNTIDALAELSALLVELMDARQ